MLNLLWRRNIFRRRGPVLPTRSNANIPERALLSLRLTCNRIWVTIKPRATRRNSRNKVIVGMLLTALALILYRENQVKEQQAKVTEPSHGVTHRSRPELHQALLQALPEGAEPTRRWIGVELDEYGLDHRRLLKSHMKESLALERENEEFKKRLTWLTKEQADILKRIADFTTNQQLQQKEWSECSSNLTKKREERAALEQKVQELTARNQAAEEAAEKVVQKSAEAAAAQAAAAMEAKRLRDAAAADTAAAQAAAAALDAKQMRDAADANRLRDAAEAESKRLRDSIKAAEAKQLRDAAEAEAKQLRDAAEVKRLRDAAEAQRLSRKAQEDEKRRQTAALAAAKAKEDAEAAKVAADAAAAAKAKEDAAVAKVAANAAAAAKAKEVAAAAKIAADAAAAKVAADAAAAAKAKEIAAAAKAAAAAERQRFAAAAATAQEAQRLRIAATQAAEAKRLRDAAEAEAKRLTDAVEVKRLRDAAEMKRLRDAAEAQRLKDAAEAEAKRLTDAAKAAEAQRLKNAQRLRDATAQAVPGRLQTSQRIPGVGSPGGGGTGVFLVSKFDPNAALRNKDLIGKFKACFDQKIVEAAIRHGGEDPHPLKACELSDTGRSRGTCCDGICRVASCFSSECTWSDPKPPPGRPLDWATLVYGKTPNAGVKGTCP